MLKDIENEIKCEALSHIGQRKILFNIRLIKILKFSY